MNFCHSQHFCLQRGAALVVRDMENVHQYLHCQPVSCNFCVTFICLIIYIIFFILQKYIFTLELTMLLAKEILLKMVGKSLRVWREHLELVQPMTGLGHFQS